MNIMYSNWHQLSFIYGLAKIEDHFFAHISITMPRTPITGSESRQQEVAKVETISKKGRSLMTGTCRKSLQGKAFKVYMLIILLYDDILLILAM